MYTNGQIDVVMNKIINENSGGAKLMTILPAFMREMPNLINADYIGYKGVDIADMIIEAARRGNYEVVYYSDCNAREKVFICLKQ